MPPGKRLAYLMGIAETEDMPFQEMCNSRAPVDREQIAIVVSHSKSHLMKHKRGVVI